MNTFPTIRQPNLKTSPIFYKPQVRTESDATYIHSRPRSTRGIHKWSLSWTYLSEADYQLLEDFFSANMGAAFTWVHPITSVSYTCRFSSDTLVGDEQVPGYRSGIACSIEEV
jgi:hypothetical protein